MNRKQFIESLGATCQNWTWSWSFINEKTKTIVFGIWDIYDQGGKGLILDEDWKISRKGKKQSGYSQSRDHIRLIEEENYSLQTFPMVYSVENEEDGTGPAKIGGFTPTVTNKTLIRAAHCWYASNGLDQDSIPEELNSTEVLLEGAAKEVKVNAYERNPVARAKCIEHYGYRCAVCAFDFAEFYGPLGNRYIHVHHVVSLAAREKEYIVDPIKDLIPLCPNCHAMIHSTRPALTVRQLKQCVTERTKHMAHLG